MKTRTTFTLFALVVVSSFSATTSFAQNFKVGVATRDITPTKPMPMWGYGARHEALSVGVMDPLHAKAVVIEAGDEKLAIVGLDLGRSPHPDSMTRIRNAVKKASGVTYILMSGSHTHHGPVLELKDEDGKGKGIYDDAVEYVATLEQDLIDVINQAAKKAKKARFGWGSDTVLMNRNRHSKLTPKPVDAELNVLRFDTTSGKPIAIIVNYAAHPTTIPASDLRFSAEYPGHMMNAVEAALGAKCVFMQGAAGDMSTKRTDETNTTEAYGKALAEKVLAIAESIETTVPEKISLQGIDQDFEFETRLDFQSKMIQGLFKNAFFPELAMASLDDFTENIIRPHLTTILLNNEVAFVGASGEFFSNHSIRLKERSRVKTLFFGYCNGHHMYFPTIEGAAEGGYGADATVSWVSIGAGEEMMNTALTNIYTMMGKYKLTIPGGGD